MTPRVQNGGVKRYAPHLPPPKGEADNQSSSCKAPNCGLPLDAVAVWSQFFKITFGAVSAWPSVQIAQQGRPQRDHLTVGWEGDSDSAVFLHGKGRCVCREAQVTVMSSHKEVSLTKGKQRNQKNQNTWLQSCGLRSLCRARSSCRGQIKLSWPSMRIQLTGCMASVLLRQELRGEDSRSRPSLG